MQRIRLEAQKEVEGGWLEIWKFTFSPQNLCLELVEFKNTATGDFYKFPDIHGVSTISTPAPPKWVRRDIITNLTQRINFK